MTSNNVGDVYPHWLDAIRNHPQFINLKCVAAYLLWQAIYGVLSVIGIVFLVFFKIGDSIARVLGPIGRPIERGLSSAKSGVKGFLKRDEVRTFLLYALVILTMAGAAVLIGTSIWAAYMIWLENPVHLFALIGGVSVVVVFLSTIRAILERYGSNIKRGIVRFLKYIGHNLKATNNRAQETPVLNRLWGVCPVDFTNAPKWYQKILARFE